MYECSKVPREENPRDKASIFSRLTFLYSVDIFKKSKHRELEEDDIYKEESQCRSESLGDVLEERWNIEVAKDKRHSLTRTLWKVYGWQSAFYAFLSLIILTPLAVIGPYATGIIVSYFEKGSSTTQQNAVIAGLILVGCGVTNAIFEQFYIFSLTRLNLRLELSVCALMYRKSLKLTATSLCQVTTGKIVTLIAKDSIFAGGGSILFVHDIWIGIIKVIIIMGVMYHRIGPSTLVGIAFLVAAIPIQIWLGFKSKQLRLKTAALTDQRLRRIQEVFTSMKLIKLFTWEKYFTKLIHTSRIREMNQLRNIYFVKAALLSISAFSYRVSYFLCVYGYYMLGSNISANDLFFIIACYKNLDSLLSYAIPSAISVLAEGRSAVKRMQQLLLMDEHDELGSTGDSVMLVGVSATILGKVVLKDVSVDLPSDSLIAITGLVGSGKTTFLKVIMKDVQVYEGTVMTTGNISYASQEPWLFPGTIRQNILFGNIYEPERYKRVLQVCALVKDLDGIPGRDMMAVIDKGMNLSKGQQARINLARAIYKKADVYLLDDVFSSLDFNVSKFVFENCIKKFLKGKLCLLVCHYKEFLADANEVIILEGGTIQSRAPYDEQLMKTFNLNTLDKLESNITGEDINDDCVNQDTDESSALLVKEVPHVKMYKEYKVAGKVHWKEYKKYFDCAGGWRIVPLVILICLVTQSMGIVFDYFANAWVDVETKMVQAKQSHSNETALDVERTIVISQYAGILVIFVILITMEYFSFLAMNVRAARNLHIVVFDKIMGATMAFIDTHLSGSILNRLSKDMAHVDECLGNCYLYSIETTFELTVSVALILYLNPALAIPTFVFFLMVLYAGRRFLASSRSLRRMEPLVRAPGIGYLNASLDGLTTIRAMGNQTILTSQFDTHQNIYGSVVYMMGMSKAAFGLWLDLFSNLFSACIIFSFIIFSDKLENIAGNVGVAVTQAIGISALLKVSVMQWAEVENSMTAAERVMEYGEAEQEITEGIEPAEWPRNAKIEYKDVTLKYPNSEAKILQGITFTIQPRHKIGIIGRTGAGKSSIISVLFRLYQSEGLISIDDVDIAKLKLHTQRSKISIIPQDPLLFKGTVRSNLDPNGDYTDADVWNSLDKVGLKNIVEKLGLSSEVEESGSNWSIGQRQLFSLARVVLRNNKIVVFDEATANMDLNTEMVVRDLIKRLFADCTIITIAHRMETVVHSDRIMVIDGGKIIEYGDPKMLLDSKSGAFYEVAKRAKFVE